MDFDCIDDVVNREIMNHENVNEDICRLFISKFKLVLKDEYVFDDTIILSISLKSKLYCIDCRVESIRLVLYFG